MIAIIAVIAGDDAVRDSTRALLECYDYAVRAYPCAEDFLCRSRDYVDCLLMDHSLPGMTGLGLLERLRSEGDLTPALVMTGSTDPSISPRTHGLGAKLLDKPVDVEHLIHEIEVSRRPCSKPARDHSV